MGALPRLAAAFLASIPLAAALPAAASPDEEKPFPVSKTTILREEKAVYTVEGRVRIPRGVSISCQKDVHIKAKDGATAVIEVEGTLELQGVASREVIVEGVTLEPCAVFKEVNVDSAIFRGGGGIRTAPDAAVDGKIFVELCSFQGGSTLDVALSGGSLDISSSSFQDAVSIRGAVPPGSKGNRVRLFIRGCVEAMGKVGFAGGLEVDRVANVVVQSSRIAGGVCAIRDWDGPMRFESNKVNSGSLEFGHSEAGRMARVTVSKCDIYSDHVKATAPASRDVRDTLVLERCWFRGETDPKVIAEKILQDGAKDEAVGARIVLGKVNDRPLELAGPVDR